MYTFDNGVTISDYEKFYVNSTTGPDLLGYCSFPTFEATPAAVQSGDDLTFTWTMDGDVTDDVYLSLSAAGALSTTSRASRTTTAATPSRCPPT